MGSSGVKKDALNNSGTADTMAATDNANAGGLYSTLAPALTAEATNPQGYSPTDLAAMNTASQESAGGSTAGAVGQGALYAARTGNAGAATDAIDASARGGMQQNAKDALAIQGENADLKEQQRQQGLGGLSSLYSTDLSGANNALGTSNSALNVAGQQKPFWQSLLQQGVQSGGQVAAAYLGG
jgi:hypothetical protein